MRLPRVQVEFIGHDRGRFAAWVDCLEGLGAGVTFKSIENPNYQDLDETVDVAIFSGIEEKADDPNFAKLCQSLKESGIFVVLMYQSPTQLQKLRSLGVQPNWAIPRSCDARERLNLSSDILDTVRFIKWAKGLQC